LINKLQNIIILLAFQLFKIRNIRFVKNLILSSSCEFYDDDITVMSLIKHFHWNTHVTNSMPLLYFLWTKN